MILRKKPKKAWPLWSDQAIRRNPLKQVINSNGTQLRSIHLWTWTCRNPL